MTTTVEAEAARVLELFITGRFEQAERAASIAQSLFWAGYLRGGRDLPDVLDRVANDLGCRMDWPVAERAAAALKEANLLTEGVTR